MLTVDDYGAIRRAHQDGKSIRQIAHEFEHSRRTIRHVLKHGEPSPGPQTRNRTADVLGPLHAIVDQILADDEKALPKQRHTAMQMFRRLQDENGYQGCYGQVQRYVLLRRRRHQETFIPLGHLPGQRLEADFGHIHVDFPERPAARAVPGHHLGLLQRTICLALPFERTEAILAGRRGHLRVLRLHPQGSLVGQSQDRRYLDPAGTPTTDSSPVRGLGRSHAFNPLFCMPARGNEKPDAESTVKAVQRRFATPVPRAADLDELNSSLRQHCEAERERIVQSLFGPFKIGDRFAEEQATASHVPDMCFDACVIRPAAPVDKYQTAAFDCNRYSVPRPFAFQMVTVKGFIDRVVIVTAGR